jgi:hypothetical protein
MNGVLTLLRLLWFGSGLLGLFILTRDPDKLVFEASLRGSMLRTIAVIFTSICALGGPVTIIIALLLHPKQICPTCYKAVPKGDAVCRRCGGLLPLSNTAVDAGPGSPISHYRVNPSVQAAVKKGIRYINYPVPFIMMGIWLVGMVLGDILFHNSLVLLLSFAVGFFAGWFWWSFSAPRWRKWALKQPGVSPEDLQAAAQEAMLVWPAGHFFEKTELK